MPAGSRPAAQIHRAQPGRRGRGLAALAWLACLLLAAVQPAGAQAQPGAVHVLAIQGVIGPTTASYLERGLQQAAQQQAALVVVRLDTPGGLDTSMRRMTQAILASPVPVAAFVAPSGARAASAGLFVLAAAHVAAMAPGTNTGAAHPVALGEETDETVAAKAVNDAAATLRSLAALRGRNAQWLEQAVRESVSATAEEALELGVIDLIAPDLDSLLAAIDGRPVTTSAGEVALRVAGAARVDVPMSLAETLLHVITDPNIAFVLLSVGSLGLVAEFYNPGAVIPGVSGVIALILAFYGLGNLPTNWAGVALLGLGLVLFIAELNTDGLGLLAVGAVVAFVLGALFLFRPFTPVAPAMPVLRVSPWLIGAVTLALGGTTFLILTQLARVRRAPATSGAESYAGRTARVTEALAPAGKVWFDGQPWNARLASGPALPPGATVRVVGREALTLIVEPVEAEPAAPA